ncbi:MAG: hypothetical protein R2883_06845 [Caldisericia bacterium]
MSAIIAYPMPDAMIIGFFDDNIKDVRYLTIDYPTSTDNFDETIKEISSEMNIPEFDIGIACLGMTDKTSEPFLDLTDEIADSLRNNEFGHDSANMTGVFIHALKPKKAILAYPHTYDCLSDTAKLSGTPKIERRMVARTLDHLIAGDDKKTVTVYLSEDEISVCAQDDGKVIDITNSYDGEGPMTPSRTGFFQQMCPYKMALSGKLSKEEMLEKIRSKGGLYAHLGTSSIDEIFKMIDDGNENAKLVYDAMIYTIHKEVGRKNF